MIHEWVQFNWKNLFLRQIEEKSLVLNEKILLFSFCIGRCAILSTLEYLSKILAIHYITITPAIVSTDNYSAHIRAHSRLLLFNNTFCDDGKKLYVTDFDIRNRQGVVPKIPNSTFCGKLKVQIRKFRIK